VARARAEITIDRSPDVVWAAIGDFDDLGWFPGIESWTVDGDVRSTKVAGMDLVHVEREVHRDDDARTYTYETVGYTGSTVVTLPDGSTLDLNDHAGRHRGTISVAAEGDGSSHVIYDTELDDDETGEVEGMGQRYQQVLVRLKGELES